MFCFFPTDDPISGSFFHYLFSQPFSRLSVSQYFYMKYCFWLSDDVFSGHMPSLYLHTHSSLYEQFQHFSSCGKHKLISNFLAQHKYISCQSSQNRCNFYSFTLDNHCVGFLWGFFWFFVCLFVFLSWQSKGK